MVQGNMPLLLSLGPVRSSEAYFTYGATNRLSGKTFSAGDKLIQIDFGYHAELGGLIEMRMAFEIRREEGTEWQNESGIIRQVPAIDRHVFEELSAGLTLSDGEFLIIGPGLSAENGLLVGGRFFTELHDGDPYEVILFVTPQPFQTEVSPGRSG